MNKILKEYKLRICIPWGEGSCHIDRCSIHVVECQADKGNPIEEAES